MHFRDLFTPRLRTAESILTSNQETTPHHPTGISDGGEDGGRDGQDLLMLTSPSANFGKVAVGCTKILTHLAKRLAAILTITSVVVSETDFNSSESAHDCSQSERDAKRNYSNEARVLIP
jgi:hypothetical protein